MMLGHVCGSAELAGNESYLRNNVDWWFIIWACLSDDAVQCRSENIVIYDIIRRVLFVYSKVKVIISDIKHVILHQHAMDQ